VTLALALDKTVISTYRTPINGLRGIAALTVAVYHFHYYSDFAWRERFPMPGFMGVDFFFLLSGLIISHVYMSDFAKFRITQYFDFLYLRLSRLFPAHIVLMVLVLFGAWLKIAFFDAKPLDRVDLVDWALQALMVRQWILPVDFAWNSPAWSISAEMFAYCLVFPVLARFASRKATAGIGYAHLGIGFACIAILIHRTETLNLVSNGGALLRVTFEFMMGVGLYWVLRDQRNKDLPWSQIFLSGAVMVILLLTYRQDLLNADLVVIADSFMLIAFCLIIAATYMSDDGASKLLGSKPFFWLGEISFALYLCHIPVFRLVTFTGSNFLDITYRGPVHSLFMLLFAIVIAHLLYSFVEKPARRFLRSQVGR